jgi:glucan phosphoethanolaminetransferase (alkaline phosphatase superfamily)
MGSHWDYRQRYPNTYDQFKPSEKSFPVEPTDVSNRNILINTYDNCILFTDAMLDSVYQIMNTQHARSMAFFIADHGEDLMDDDNHYYLHGNFPTLFNTHVPFFIWYNDSIKNSCSEKICELIRHRDNKIGAENIFPTITNLCDIYFSGEDSTKCIDRSSFIDSKQKIIYLHNDTLNKTITFDSLKILASRTVKF